MERLTEKASCNQTGNVKISKRKFAMGFELFSFSLLFLFFLMHNIYVQYEYLYIIYDEKKVGEEKRTNIYPSSLV